MSWCKIDCWDSSVRRQSGWDLVTAFEYFSPVRHFLYFHEWLGEILGIKVQITCLRNVECTYFLRVDSLYSLAIYPGGDIGISIVIAFAILVG